MDEVFRVAISTASDPQGAGRVDILTHPYTTTACAAGAVTRTAGRDSSRYRWIAKAIELNRHVTRRVRMKIRGSVVSLPGKSFIFPPSAGG